jgi:hypothetical protein
MSIGLLTRWATRDAQDLELRRSVTLTVRIRSEARSVHLADHHHCGDPFGKPQHLGDHSLGSGCR